LARIASGLAQLTALKKDYFVGYRLGVAIQEDGRATPGTAYGDNGGGLGNQDSVQVFPNGSRVAVLPTNRQAITNGVHALPPLLGMQRWWSCSTSCPASGRLGSCSAGRIRCWRNRRWRLG
jgi:hypothetical protein